MNTNQTSINYGLIGGMAAIALSLLYYLMNVSGFITWGAWFSYLALGATMVMAGLAIRKAQDGFIEFKEALKVTFLVWVIGTILTTLFMYAMFNFIDPGLVDVQKEVTMEWMEKFTANMDEETLDEINKRIAEEGFGLNLKKSLLGYGVGLIFPGFIIALIVSLIIRRKNPELEV
ncbi:MAG: DUF4199 domain-containing protein [Saprospiraceae bacterium]|nr:DUF4199 domain-containing protein [Saprospiraceae bacterium]